MPPTPADLREAADSLRRRATLVDLAFDDVVPRSGPDTWQGSAADAFRYDLRRVRQRVDRVAHGFREVARRLDDAAGELEAEVVAAEREAERLRRIAQECRRREATLAGGTGRGIFSLGGPACGPPAAYLPRPGGEVDLGRWNRPDRAG